TNQPIYSLELQVFNYPSDPANMNPFTRLPGTPSDFYTANKVARSSYLFGAGISTDYDASWENLGLTTRGAFGNDGAAQIGFITDGTSNSIVVGESKQLHAEPSWNIFGPYWGAGVHTCCHMYTPGDVRFTVNGKYDAAT